MAGLDVMVVGQVARDLVLLVDEVPEAGGTAPVRRRRELLGGKGANQAVGLAQLGAAVGLLGGRPALTPEVIRAQLDRIPAG
ncbi:PfkB family carbohydrate kinase [Micromonospora sp. NPDC049051]|uniref:PfkB family carbohydrate kinase n=1 Tax=Micromonospora sp. NPDC049051 TaxID=3364264 RepID=UPI00371BEE3C